MHENDVFDFELDFLKTMTYKETSSIFHHLPSLMNNIEKLEEVEEKKENDLNNVIKSNNLSNKEQSILFFETFKECFENKEMDKIALFIDKLTYLGFSCSNKYVFSWKSDEDLVSTLIDVCFLLYQEKDTTKYLILFDTCLNMLKQ